MAVKITQKYELFKDVDGDPLENGYIYIGTAGLNPETSPITVYFDEALTLPASQPLRTSGGYVQNAGTPANIYIDSDYSITVRNKNETLIYTSLSNNAEAGLSSSVDTIGDLIGLDEATTTEELEVYGYYAKGDGSGGLFIWDSTISKADANRGTIIDPSVSLANQGTGVGTGCWIRQYEGAIYIEWFGAKGSGFNNSQIIKDICENFKHITSNIDVQYTIVATDFGDSYKDGILLTSDIIIENLNIYCTGSVGSGIHTEMSSLFIIRDKTNIIIKNCIFDSSSELDARITSTEKGIFSYIGISSSSNHASNNIKVLNNTFTKNLGTCISGLSSHLDSLYYYISDIIVEGNYFHDMGNHCFGMQKGFNNKVSNNIMYNQHGTQFTGYVVGMFCDFSNGTIGSICEGNICRGVQTGIKTESTGYLDNYAQNNIISNNIFMDFKGEGSSTSNYGIQLNGTYDRAYGNTIKLGVDPDTDIATTTEIIGLKTQSAAYKCSFNNNNVQVNGVGVWCYTREEITNDSFITIENNIIYSDNSLSIQFVDTFNGSIINNKLYGSDDIISIQGLNSKIIGNEIYTDSPSTSAIYFNQPTINIDDDNFEIADNKIRIETSGITIDFNVSNQYNEVIINNNDIVSKSDSNVINLYSTNNLIFVGNKVIIDNTGQTTDRRCLMLRSSAYVCTDAIITGNTLHNNGASFGNTIFGEFKNSVISNNSLKSKNTCINLDSGNYTMISNNSWDGSSISSSTGANTVVQNNIQKLG